MCGLKMFSSPGVRQRSGDAILLAALGTSATSEGDRWAIRKLSAGGEDVIGQPAAPQYLLLALVILLTPLGVLSSLADMAFTVILCLPSIRSMDHIANYYAITCA